MWGTKREPYPGPPRTYYLGAGALKGPLGPTIWVLGGLGLRTAHNQYTTRLFFIGLWTTEMESDRVCTVCQQLKLSNIVCVVPSRLLAVIVLENLGGVSRIIVA